MQNRYLCDIGDFGKYGMLREVLKSNLVLGFNWYLHPDEAHNNDGKHKQYLINDKYDVGTCDIKLYSFLQNVVMKNPDKKLSIDLVESGGILSGTVFYNQLLDVERLPDLKSRQIIRENWFTNSLDVLSNCDIVFCDPDNGFEVPSITHTDKKSGKYIFYDEAKKLYDSGKSLIIYHHGPLWFKHGDLEPFIDGLCCNIHDQVTNNATIKCLRWLTTAKRFYIWVIRPEHEKVLLKVIDKLSSGLWCTHFSQVGATTHSG